MDDENQAKFKDFGCALHSSLPAACRSCRPKKTEAPQSQGRRGNSALIWGGLKAPLFADAQARASFLNFRWCIMVRLLFAVAFANAAATSLKAARACCSDCSVGSLKATAMLCIVTLET